MNTDKIIDGLGDAKEVEEEDEYLKKLEGDINKINSEMLLEEEIIKDSAFNQYE